ncbi:aldo/keto reductase [Companilactobacillus sp. HBUAS56275]|uniref:aldo/keto reductase n=1 Tax=Companilactobacillus sp. HBUAS56275 TaxID=3109364 RepID=UPI002FF1C1E2
MLITKETIALNNGIEMPKMALGTWFMSDDNKTSSAVKTAINYGYRHIDTAQSYKNERSVGIGIKESGISRENMFVTSKIDAEIKDYKTAVNSIDQTIDKMGLDYLDLMLIHNPQPWTKILNPDKRFFDGNLEVWRALTNAVTEGKVRSMGVSNFTSIDLKNIIDNSQIRPSVNQAAINIGNIPKELIDYDNENNILTEAYSVVPHGILLNHPEIQRIADKYHISISQLCIRFIWQLGLPLWRKSSSAEHIKQNIDINFKISDFDMNRLLHIENSY